MSESVRERERESKEDYEKIGELKEKGKCCDKWLERRAIGGLRIHEFTTNMLPHIHDPLIGETESEKGGGHQMSPIDGVADK